MDNFDYDDAPVSLLLLYHDCHGNNHHHEWSFLIIASVGDDDDIATTAVESSKERSKRMCMKKKGCYAEGTEATINVFPKQTDRKSPLSVVIGMHLLCLCLRFSFSFCFIPRVFSEFVLTMSSLVVCSLLWISSVPSSPSLPLQSLPNG